MVGACKRMSTATTALKIAGCLICLTLLLNIIGFSTTYWYVSHIGNYNTNKVHGGLWQVCYCYYSGTSCLEICANPNIAVVEASDYMQYLTKAIQCIAVLGLIALVAAMVLVLLQIFISSKKCMKCWAIFFDLFAGVAILISVVIYALVNRLNTGEFGFHYSFYFCATASVLCFVIAPFLCRDRTTVYRSQPTTLDVVYTPRTGQVIAPVTPDLGGASYINQSSGAPMVAPSYINQSSGAPMVAPSYINQSSGASVVTPSYTNEKSGATSSYTNQNYLGAVQEPSHATESGSMSQTISQLLVGQPPPYTVQLPPLAELETQQHAKTGVLPTEPTF